MAFYARNIALKCRNPVIAATMAGGILFSKRELAFCEIKGNPPIDTSTLNRQEILSPKSPNPNAAPDNYCVYTKTRKVNFPKMYMLTRSHSAQTNVIGTPCKYDGPGYTLELSASGVLTITSGFLWNGPTAFIPLESMMRGSLVHDGFYELFSKHVKKLDRDQAKPLADKLLKQMFIEDGCPKLLAEAAYQAVTYLSWIFEDWV